MLQASNILASQAYSIEVLHALSVSQSKVCDQANSVWTEIVWDGFRWVVFILKTMQLLISQVWQCVHFQMIFPMTISKNSPKWPSREPQQLTATTAARWTSAQPRSVNYGCVSSEMLGTPSATAVDSLLVFVILQELKTVLLGSSQKCFNAEWRNQGFTFSETHDLRYGIVQKKVVLMVPFS